ncbi:uncharacterized protein LOC110758864 isoform X3 [Prunus avium]|uniref:Uncharacterized protein LOC110758864 isoform X3 n=1 Tax=Prunus avium TaxID=42229 RepID=A0A6P5SHS3_PRUAV|nr:uncharacterized protein LOC110758864 isoform X3 [Prunus avium]
MMRVVNRLLSASKWSKRIDISPNFAAAPFRVGQNRVYLHDQERFCPGSYGGLFATPYVIFKRKEGDTLPRHVYHGTYCGLPVAVHYMKNSDARVQKWLGFQDICNSGFVLSVRALYHTSYGLTIVFTEPVESSLSSWVAMMKRDQMPFTDPSGYIIPFLSSVYRDVLTSMIHIRDYIGLMHGDVTLDNIWLRKGTAVLGCPNVSCGVTDTEMLEDVFDTIHDVFLPKELDFFCRILNNDVTVMLSLWLHSPFLKTHTEKMRARFLFVRLFFDSSNGVARENAINVYKSYWDSFFANEAEFEVMWHRQLRAQNPITTKRLNLVTNEEIKYAVRFIIPKWMVDGHPIHFLITVRNCAEHGTHLESEEFFDLHVSAVWPEHLSMLSHLVSLRHLELFLSSFTAFTLKGCYSCISATSVLHSCRG